MKLDIKAYFFDAKRDYLPYYKNFELSVEADNPISQILPMIKQKNRDFSYPDENLLFRVNGLVLDGSQTVQEVVSRVGTKLQIDPVSSYRATDGLSIDDADFMQSLELLAPYTSEEDKSYYKTLYPLHYASETFRYNNRYIGDAILILAAKMIKDGNTHKEEILNAIASDHEGLWECEYENNLFVSQEYGDTISKLQKEAKDAPGNYSPLFPRKYKTADIESIEGRSVAFYAGSDKMSQDITESTLEQIQSKGARAIRFDMSNKLAGQTILKTNPKMAYLKMGTMLLDAFDNGADLLVVSSEEDAELFQKSIGYCEKITQRDIKLDIIPRGKLMGMSGKAVA